MVVSTGLVMLPWKTASLSTPPTECCALLLKMRMQPRSGLRRWNKLGKGWFSNFAVPFTVCLLFSKVLKHLISLCVATIGKFHDARFFEVFQFMHFCCECGQFWNKCCLTELHVLKGLEEEILLTLSFFPPSLPVSTHQNSCFPIDLSQYPAMEFNYCQYFQLVYYHF